MKKVGANPVRFSGDLKLVEIDNSAKDFSLFKPTNKDGRFDPYFRYNTENSYFGKTLNLNEGIQNSVNEYVIKDIDLLNDTLKNKIKLENI